MPRRCAVEDATLIHQFPGGVAPREALVELGMSHSTISARCRPGKPWQRPIPGVIVFSNGTLTRQELRRAALVHAGPGAMLTGIEAARMYGVKRLPADRRVHVLVAHKRGVSSWGFATVERTVHLPEPIEIDGLPVVPLARALFDAARRMTDLDEVRAMIADAVQRGLCDPRDLKREIAEGSTIGSGLSRRVTYEMEAGIRSAAEAWARTVVRRSQLPDPKWNAGVYSSDGELLGVPDAYWEEVGLAMEVDSFEFHLGPADYERTVRKHTRLTAAGVVVVHVLPSHLRDSPLTVVHDLRRAYHQAVGRPPPQVDVVITRPAA
ncbi:hypothetical protein [Amycolatopsis pigmentata]|uniref:Transcriptional regulator, AbiEi antitoxin, Type IV TA system n=1 Tax=Amycolatopsis pigmentata TaxID=450801 RepID=A0ABW5G1H3_9PSEU